MQTRVPNKTVIGVLVGVPAIVGLYLSSVYSYLLFHTLAEIFSVLIAFTIFILAWNGWKYIENPFLRFIGIAYLFIGGLDLVHTLAYKGMNIFPGYGSNLPTQLWIATRYTEAAALLIGSLFMSRLKAGRGLLIGVFSLIVALIIATTFTGVFPDAYREGEGLTGFKIISEFIIVALLAGVIVQLLRTRAAFSRSVLHYLMISLGLTIVSELAFVFYIDVYGISNMVGHLFKIASFFFIYKAIVEKGIQQPFELVFRELKQYKDRLEHEITVKQQKEQQLQQDIAKREELEKRLIDEKNKADEANKLKSIFLASISHEIRTPLNAVIGMLDIVLDGDSMDKENTEFLRIARESSYTLLQLINDLLDFSRIEANRFKMEEIPFSLQAVVEDIDFISSMAIKRTQKQLEFKTVIPDDIGREVIGDPERLKQVLLNLINNAVKFTDRGTITLKVSVNAPETIDFSVQDTGIGIPLDKQQIIFQPFRQAEEKTTKKYGGTGLGLSISKHLVELMGGTIGFDSGPGKGSTFYFSIPYRPAERTPEGTTAKAKESPRTTEEAVCERDEKTVLVVEDEKTNRLVVTRMLQKAGYSVMTAENGKQALSVYGENPSIDVILMDLYMPEVDGITATSEIRSFERERGRARTPVITFTAAGNTEDMTAVKEAGSDAYLPKPVDRKRLIELLQKFA